VNSTVRASLPTTLLKTSTQYATSALVTVLDDVASTAGDGLIQRFDGARHVSYWPVGERRVAVALNRFDESEPIASLVAFTRIASSIQPAVARWLTEQTQPPTLHHYRYADIELSRFVHRRVALIGDAAHAMSPQLGLGSSMGLLDAVELARALEKSDNVASALDAYDAIRRPIVAAHQKNSRFVTPLFQSSAIPLVLTRDRMLSQLGRFSVARRMMLSHLF
jgi:2-polyprenyl-6-methoxyphenol hydroxylase-like FAD-dependent oxidoreductase